MIPQACQQLFAFLTQHALWFLTPTLALVFAYFYFLPRPLAGIPYDHASAKRLLGDLPKLYRHTRSQPQVGNFFANECLRLNSPIIQFFLSPFESPAVVVSDMREIEDIFTRRSRELDRADINRKALESLIGQSTIAMATDDRFKAQRKLWAGSMTPEFVDRVGSNHIYQTTTCLVELWKRKAELAQGHPFEAADDLRCEGFDAIWGFSFGTELGTTKAQVEHLAVLDRSTMSMPDNVDEAVAMPRGEAPPIRRNFAQLFDRFAAVNTSPLPFLTFWLLTKSPSYKRAIADKDSHMTSLIASSRAAFADKASGTVDEDLADSAMDQVLRREHNSKIQSLTEPLRDKDRHLKDELFSFLIAGYETTSTTLSWAVKLFAANPAPQSHLRHALRSAFPHRTPADPPSAHEILKAHIPYLDATVAEVLRCAQVAPLTVRQATGPTTILGAHIPKNTLVFLCMNGASYEHTGDIAEPADRERSSTSKMYGGLRGQHYRWPVEDRQAFRPERWLRSRSAEAGDGTARDELDFDDKAGPSIPFALGPRGCFGKRLALTKLRITICLLVLGFEFLEVKGYVRDGKETFELGGFDAVERVTREPKRAYVRLRAL